MTDVERRTLDFLVAVGCFGGVSKIPMIDDLEKVKRQVRDLLKCNTTNLPKKNTS
jgi:hypothetical protein